MECVIRLFLFNIMFLFFFQEIIFDKLQDFPGAELIDPTQVAITLISFGCSEGYRWSEFLSGWRVKESLL